LTLSTLITKLERSDSGSRELDAETAHSAERTKEKIRTCFADGQRYQAALRALSKDTDHDHK